MSEETVDFSGHEGHDVVLTDSGIWCDDCDERLHCGVLV